MVGGDILRKPSSLQQYVAAYTGARLHCSLREEANQKNPRISSTLEMFPERCGGAKKIKEKKDGV
jgi:hypothetical protein